MLPSNRLNWGAMAMPAVALVLRRKPHCSTDLSEYNPFFPALVVWHHPKMFSMAPLAYSSFIEADASATIPRNGFQVLNNPGERTLQPTHHPQGRPRVLGSQSASKRRPRPCKLDNRKESVLRK